MKASNHFGIASVVCAASGISLLSLSASAQIVVDGQRDAAYGAALAVQSVQTGVGDANPPGNPGGSELDAAYAKIANGRLYILLTGNLEPANSKLDIFIDSKSGGENVLTGTPQYDLFGGSTWISQNLAGLKFDASFAADYHLFAQWGSGSGPYRADFVNRQGGGSASVPGSTGFSPNAAGLVATGSIPAGQVGTNASVTSLTATLQFAINDNNAAGVAGGSDAADSTAALAVTTGMEFSIALTDLGNPAVGSTILIAAMINNGDHNYLSNQLLGGLPSPRGNLGGDGGGGFTGTLTGVDFSVIAGLQYFSIPVPQPSLPRPFFDTAQRLAASRSATLAAAAQPTAHSRF